LRLRRIVVALDASPASLAALESAAGLADGPQSELLGLFVEDVELLRFAGLPFAAEVGFPGGSRRPLDPISMDRMLKGAAQRAREALSETARRRGVKWSFRTRRGSVDQSLLEVVEGSDLIALGAAGFSARVGRRAGSTAMRIALKARVSVLLQASPRPSGPVAVVYSGSEVSRHSLAAARSLAESRAQALVVLLEPDGPGAGRAREEEVRRAMGEWAGELRFRVVARPDGPGLLHALEEEECGALVLGGSDLKHQGDRLAALLEEARVDLLIVR
jgi:nucleotide-binding universal stress UspA family protein